MAVQQTSLNLEIGVDEAESLLNLYRAKLDFFIKDYQDIFTEYQRLTSKINQLESFLTPPKSSTEFTALPQGYPLAGSWNDKISFVLRKDTAEVLGGYTAKEIVDRIMEIEGIRDEPDERKKVRIGVYSTLSANFSAGKLYKRERHGDKGDFLYSLK